MKSICNLLDYLALGVATVGESPASRALRAVVAIALIGSSYIAHAEQWTFQRIDGGSQAFAVSATGTVVGMYWDPQLQRQLPFSYANGVSTFIPMTGGYAGAAKGVNSSGMTVGWYEPLGGGSRAFAYVDGVFTDLSSLVGVGSVATAVNDLGQIVGTRMVANGETHGFLLSNGSVTDIGVLNGGWFSTALDINNSGEVAGWSNIGQRQIGFVWDGELSAAMPASGDQHSYVNAINDLGQYAGATCCSAAYSPFAVLSDGIQESVLPPDWIEGEARGINNLGDVVGFGYSRTGPAGFLYSNGEVIDLAEIDAVRLAGARINQVYAINDARQIVGEAFANGDTFAFILTPTTRAVPEPTTIGLVLAAIGAAAALRGRGIGAGTGYQRWRAHKRSNRPLILAPPSARA